MKLGFGRRPTATMAALLLRCGVLPNQIVHVSNADRRKVRCAANEAGYSRFRDTKAPRYIVVGRRRAKNRVARLTRRAQRTA